MKGLSLSGAKIDFLSDKHPIQRINDEIRKQLADAQANSFDRAFSNAMEFVSKVADDLRLQITLSEELKDSPAADLAEKGHSELVEYYEAILQKSGVVGTSADLHSVNLAQRTQLVRSFADPDRAVGRVATKVAAIVKDFPKQASDIERGRNAGDVLDPYILAATQSLLYQGELVGAIEATVAHKALMIIEGLMGHLHEDVIGDMRGNIRAPEPRGFNQEILDPFTNPFPGADVVQPPRAAGERLRVHQVKSKTGSAKGGDAKRLGNQLRRLAEYYDADTFYDALVGNTLRGHRSMNGVLRASPDTTVLVGQAAFKELTRSATGPELLLRVYQNAFTEVAKETGYHIQEMATGIVATFRERADAAGEGFLDVILEDVIGGDASQQDSREYVGGRRARR